MSDPNSTTPPAAQEPAQGAPAGAAPSAPAPAAAAPQTTSEAPAKPPYVNPWQGRAPAPVAPAAKPAAPAAAPPPAADPRVDALMAVLGETVAQDLGALPANVAATVKAIAGDDPVAQRRAINAMRANGLATVATNAAPLPPPASTVMPMAPAAPAPQGPAADDAARLTEYEKLAKAAPTLANAYRLSHAESINRALAARTPAN